jgi:hypothetical protein
MSKSTAYITPSIASSDMTIIQNPNLKRLKKAATKALLIEFQRLGGIDNSDNPIVNTCQEIILYKEPRPGISSSSSYNDEETPVNRNGKRMTKCQYCNKLYEKKTGLRIHQMYCKDKK